MSCRISCCCNQRQLRDRHVCDLISGNCVTSTSVMRIGDRRLADVAALLTTASSNGPITVEFLVDAICISFAIMDYIYSQVPDPATPPPPPERKLHLSVPYCMQLYVTCLLSAVNSNDSHTPACINAFKCCTPYIAHEQREKRIGML